MGRLKKFRVLYLGRFLTFVPLFGAAIAYTDHTYSDRVCVVGYFLVPFTCVQLLSVYCVVKMCAQHTA